MDIGPVIQQVLVLFILLLVGMVARRVKILTEDGVKSISGFVVNVTMPCLAVTSLQRSFTPDTMQRILLVALISLCVHFSSFLLGSLLVRRMDKDKASVFHYATAFSNSGYIGIPVIQAAMGADATVYAVAFMLGGTVAMWTFGVYIFAGKQGVSLKNIVRNPGVIGMVVGFLLFVLQLKIPYIPLTAMNALSDMTPGLSMILVGANLPRVSWQNFLDVSIYIQSLIRLVVLPLLLYVVLRIINVDSEVLMSTVILTGMPVAAVTSVFATQYGSDAEYASMIIFITTLLSIPVIPLMMMLF